MELSESADQSNRIPIAYWVMSLLLVLYVGLCTGNRENGWAFDAWEHHRALKALVEDPWNPGNPTVAVDEPSARYSPYLVGWAFVSRAFGLDSFRTLSLAATVNTALTLLGVAFLLKGFGEGGSAACAIPIILGLYGGVPGHSNSLALADLPIQQVNPSAISVATSLFVMALFKRFERRGWIDFSIPLMILLTATSLLDHVISASVGQLGIWIFALTAGTKDRLRLIAGAAFVGLCGVGLCLLWPWYDFVRAATIKLPDGLVNIYIIYVILSEWAVPALISSVVCFTLQNATAARTLLLAGYASYMIGFVLRVLPASLPGAGALTRLPLPGMIFFHLALGIYAHRVGLFRLSTWPGRLATLVRARGPEAAPQALQVAFAATLAYFLLPQLFTVFQSPVIARPYVASLMGRADKQLHIKTRFDQLLEPIGLKDVVMSDEQSMSAIPSSKGRVVAPHHPELFVVDQTARHDDVQTFFTSDTSNVDRIKILERYGVKWIVLNEALLDRSTYNALYDPDAVVKGGPGLVLLDADRWTRSRKPPKEGGTKDKPVPAPAVR